jgi:Tol biopolymer transport system component
MTDLTAGLVVDGRAPQTPVLAPNGRLLCYVLAPTSRTGDHLDTELWLVDTDSAAASRRATADTAAESLPRWSADSATLFFLSDRADRGTPQVHRLTLADGTVTALTGWRTGIVDHLFDPRTGTAEDLGPVEPDAGSLAWWPGEDGWHLG